MIGRLGPLAVALVLAALFAAGCGDDSNSGSTDTGSTPAATTTEAAATDTTTTDSSSGGGSLADNPQVKAAIEQCKKTIDDNPQVPDNVKGDLKSLCDKAASGKPQDTKKIAKEVCLKIVESSLPAGDARDQAKAACDQAGA